jgi:hypothetical protein
MENNEYGKLIDFLGKKFENIDEKFEKIDKRFDAMEAKFATKEELKSELKDSERRTGILIEEVNHKIDLVIEGQQGIIQKLDWHIDENDSEHKRLEHMVMEDRADIYNIKKRLS